jgi:hypothetical protein
MKSRAVLALASVLALSSPLRAAAVAADPLAYDAKAAPLDDLSKELLTGNGYELRDDGTVWDKINEAPVARTDMPYLLSRLASARRLKALLEINNIVTRYSAERKMSAEDKEAVKEIARKNWIVFGVAPRNDFRSYFSIQEQEELDKIPARFAAMGAVTLTDPLPESVTAAPPAAPVPAAVVPAAVVAASTQTSPAPEAKMVPVLAPMMDMPALKRPSPFAAVPAAPPVLPAVVPPPVVPAAAIAPTPPSAPAAPGAKPVVLATPELGVLKPWTPPPASTEPVAAVPPPAPAPAAVAVATAPAVPAPPAPPKPAVIGAPEYEKFVAQGPYTKEGRELLALIGKRAPDYCLPLLRRTVVGAVPQIVIDGARTGTALRAALLRDAADPLAPPTVALSPGPVIVEEKTGLFGRKDAVLLPESPQAWSDLGLSRPALDAFRPDAAPASVRSDDWGATKFYADGSRRGTYSPEERAGELLEQLLRLGLIREGLDASDYAARRWARGARLMFSARLKDEMKRDSFLDPDRRAELRAWLDRPEEADDDAAAAWSGSRLQILDPRRGPPDAERDFDSRAAASCGRAALEDALAAAGRRRARVVGTLEALTAAKVVDDAAAKAAAQSAVDAAAADRAKALASPPPCAPPDAARDEALRKSSVLLAEEARAERALREAQAEGRHAF